MNRLKAKSTDLGHTVIAMAMAIAIFSVLCVTSAQVSTALASTVESSVVDSLGRSVIIPSRVDRIGCLYAFTGHVVAMLGKADSIVAVSNGLKRDVLLTKMFPVIAKAVVPKVQGAINIEELKAVNPDIVFLQTESGRNSAFTDKLDAVGITWIAVDFHNMAQQRSVISMIGRVVGATEKATLYNQYYLHCIVRVRQVTSTIPIQERPHVYHATVEPYRTSQSDSLPSDWLSIAGVVNVAAMASVKVRSGTQQIGIEQILLWNPDIILANEPATVNAIREDPKWAPVTAVIRNRVYQLPVGISRWGHPGSLETPLAILWTAKAIYPEKLQRIDMAAEMKYFYQKFFNFELSEETIKQILNGKGMRRKKGWK
jgi:iron complex transport system substrate-binding protein